MYIENIDGLSIKIDECYKITNDAIDLADYVLNDNIDEKTMLEIGSGSGYISLKLRNKFKKITAVEIQKIASLNLVENIRVNKIENISVINTDIKKHDLKYDVIVSNPPFFKMNSGKLPEDEIKLLSKFEKELTMEDLINKTYSLLNDRGLFYFIYPLNRLDEFMLLKEKYDFKILDIYEKAKRAIIKGQKS